MFRIAIVFFAFVLPLSSFASVYTEELDGNRYYRTTIRHIESGGIGYNNGYTTFAVFLASDPNEWKVIPFLDARGHVFDNGRWAANAGMGLRALWGNRAYGINSYYDYRNTDRFNANQIGAGLETLGARWDFRLNGYLPIGAKTSNPYDLTFGSFSGNYLLVSEKIQSAMKGANAEVGVHFAKSTLFDFYAAAGPYYFIGKGVPATWGGKARVSGTFKNMVALEVSDSYDRTFYNKFQGQIAFSFSFGSKSKVKKQACTCKVANTLNNRMWQSVDRQEIIVIDNTKQNTIAIDPATGEPYFFVFVDNTSSSDGTYESPFHSLVQAQNNSSPNDIIYVFPGDGTTTGMDVGITLQANQKFWGSGISYLLSTAQGAITIPAQSSTNPTVTNTDIDTAGNAVTLATNNTISGFTLTSAVNDAIYGADPQSLDVSFCTFENTITYTIEAVFTGDASISLTNNQFSNNSNGVILTLNGTSTLVCSNNTFEDQTSISSIPLEIVANNNTIVAQIENNLFNNNTTGSVWFDLNNAADVAINLLNNTMTNNGAGAEGNLGSSFVIISDGTIDNCSIVVSDNTFSTNGAHCVYFPDSGAFTNLDLTVSANTMSNNGRGGLNFSTAVDTLTLLVTDNLINGCEDNGIAVVSSGSTTTGNVTINNNTITNIGNESNGIIIGQDFETLNLTILNNEINSCEGTGILNYAPDGIDSLTLNISGNTINNCENLSSNAAPGLDIEQYTNLAGSITDNMFSGNVGTAVFIGSALTAPSACLTFTGNDSSTDYLLSNPVDGLFNISPCQVDSLNTGTIYTEGTIDTVQSCSNPVSCSP